MEGCCGSTSSKVYTGLCLYPENMSEEQSDRSENESEHGFTSPEEVDSDGTENITGLRERICSGNSVLRYSGKVVPPSAFYYTPLKEAVLQGAEIVGSKAFRNSELRQIRLSEGLIRIEPGAFYGTRPKEVILPISLQYISVGAFSCCEQLETVRLPSGLKKIDRRAFSCCRSLKKLFLPGVDRLYCGRCL